MLKEPAVTGRTLAQSDQQPPTGSAALTFTLTETDVTAQRTTAVDKSVVIGQIAISATCSGTIGTLNYAGTGSAVISAASPRVTCEDQELVLEGANVVLACSGTTTDPSTGSTVPNVPASIKVTVSDAGQTTVEADDA